MQKKKNEVPTPKTEAEKELYPDLPEFLPLKRRTRYESDGEIPPRTWQAHCIVDKAGDRITVDLPLTLVDYIAEACDWYTQELERPVRTNGQRGRLLGRIMFPVNPITKKNSQQLIPNKRTGRAFIVPSKIYTNTLNDIKRLGKTIWQSGPRVKLPLDRPLSLECHYYRDSRRRVDVTNLESAAMDMLVELGVLADDNCRIVNNTNGSQAHYDKDNPRTEILIYEWKESHNEWA